MFFSNRDPNLSRLNPALLKDLSDEQASDLKGGMEFRPIAPSRFFFDSILATAQARLSAPGGTITIATTRGNSDD